MRPKTILRHLQAGRTVTYTVRRLRGYLHGDAILVIKPQDAAHGLNNITMWLRNFRFDEKPYDKPRWKAEVIHEATNAIVRKCPT
jgi:hypothetical protein